MEGSCGGSAPSRRGFLAALWCAVISSLASSFFYATVQELTQATWWRLSAAVCPRFTLTVFGAPFSLVFAHLRSSGSVSCMRCTTNGKAVARVQLLPGGRAHSSYLPSTRGGLVAHFAAASRVQTRSGVQARGPFQAQVLAWLFRRLEKEATARLLREEKAEDRQLAFRFQEVQAFRAPSRLCPTSFGRPRCGRLAAVSEFPKKCLCCRRGRYPRQVLYLPARQQADGQAVFSQGQYVLRCDCCGHRLNTVALGPWGKKFRSKMNLLQLDTFFSEYVRSTSRPLSATTAGRLCQVGLRASRVFLDFFLQKAAEAGFVALLLFPQVPELFALLLLFFFCLSRGWAAPERGPGQELRSETP